MTALWLYASSNQFSFCLHISTWFIWKVTVTFTSDRWNQITSSLNPCDNWSKVEEIPSSRCWDITFRRLKTWDHLDDWPWTLKIYSVTQWFLSAHRCLIWKNDLEIFLRYDISCWRGHSDLRLPKSNQVIHESKWIVPDVMKHSQKREVTVTFTSDCWNLISSSLSPSECLRLTPGTHQTRKHTTTSRQAGTRADRQGEMHVLCEQPGGCARDYRCCWSDVNLALASFQQCKYWLTDTSFPHGADCMCVCSLVKLPNTPNLRTWLGCCW